MIKQMLDLIMPHHCCSCRTIGPILCHCCKKRLLESCQLQQECREQARGWGADLDYDLKLEGLYCLGLRRGLLKCLLDNYKFKCCRDIAPILADLLASFLPKELELQIVPLPTTNRHNRQRGFDHVLYLAQALAEHSSQWSVAAVLERQHQRSQRGLSRLERLANAQDMFCCQIPLAAENCYLILDDVYTTGASLRAALKALQQAGARHLRAAVLVRQPDLAVILKT